MRMVVDDCKGLPVLARTGDAPLRSSSIDRAVAVIALYCGSHRSGIHVALAESIGGVLGPEEALES